MLHYFFILSILPVRSYKIFVIYDPCRFDIPVITGSHQIGIDQKRWRDSLISEFMLEFPKGFQDFDIPIVGLAQLVSNDQFARWFISVNDNLSGFRCWVSLAAATSPPQHA